MAFRISQIKKSGERIKSILINDSEALISATEKADLKVDFPKGSFIKVNADTNSCSLTPFNLKVSAMNREISSGTINLGTGSEFFCSNYSFYITLVNDGKPTLFKKGYLATLAIILTWSLLAIQLIVPAWLPYKITSHTVQGRSVLLENCSQSLDSLTRLVNESKNQISSKSAIHNEIIVQLKEEIGQITWTYRNASDFMGTEELNKLLNDVERYKTVINRLQQSQVIKVDPINQNSVIDGLAL